MTRGAPGTSFNRSRLIRVLADLEATGVADSKQPFAERLGGWLDFTDAMALFSVLNGSPAEGAAARTEVQSPAVGAVGEEMARVRGMLVDSIRTDGVFTPGKARIRLPVPAPNASPESAADFSPYHRYYLAHQRDMSASIAPLRVNARAELAAHSSSLRQLAELDAVLDQAVGVRERNLLSTIPLLLARHFAHLYKAHQAALPEPQESDCPSRWMQPDGWLAAFCKVMQGVLLAELEVRLQPVEGLIEALGNEVGKQQ